MKYKISVFVFLLPLLFANGVVFKMTNAVCKSHNKSWVTIENCRLHALQRNKTIFNVMANFLHPTNYISMRMQVMKKANGYKPWVFDITFDVCKFMRDKSNKAAKVVFDLFKDFSTVNHSCPYVGRNGLVGFYPVPEKLKVPLPTGDYLILISWKFYNKLQFVTNVYFTFVEDY